MAQRYAPHPPRFTTFFYFKGLWGIFSPPLIISLPQPNQVLDGPPALRASVGRTLKEWSATDEPIPRISEVPLPPSKEKVRLLHMPSYDSHRP
jgi:hypothetical protein